MARRSGPAFPSRQKRPWPSRAPEEREWRAQQRYLKVLREVKEECGDTALSSDEEGACPRAPGLASVSTAAACPPGAVGTVAPPPQRGSHARALWSVCGLFEPGVELGVPGPPALRHSHWAAVTADPFTLGTRVPVALVLPAAREDCFPTGGA